MNLPRGVIIRVYLLYFVVAMAMIAVIAKTFFIVMDGRASVFTTPGETKLEQRSAFVEPSRGEILDVNLNPLVTSVTFYDVYMDPVTVKDELWNSEIGNLSIGLSALFGDKSAREYEEKLRKARSRGHRYVLIQKRVTNETRKNLRKLPIFKEGRIKGGIIDNETTIVRKRPNGDMLSRTLGYVRINEKDSLLVGIEGAYNDFLSGKKGEVIEQRISHGWRPTGTVVREAINGYDIVTTIDKDIQEVAQSELKKQLQNTGGRYGTVVVMEVKTGFVKAIANLQENGKGGYEELYNHAVGTKEVPGSTMKLASLMAALEDGKIKLSDTVNAVGNYDFYGKTLKDSRGWGYGKITIKDAFAHSSNVISKVIFNAYRSEPEKFIAKLDQFGLTQKTGVNIPGESEPVSSLPGTSNWWGGSLAWLSIGYEIQLTPLQMLAFYNAVANGGKYMEPQFVSKVIDNRREVIKEYKPVVKHESIASKATIDTMRSALEEVMISGTGKGLKTTFFKVAGKTGTAQIANDNRGYGNKGEQKYLASFAGYFPADDPIYSCIVVVGAPTNDIYGASVSGTVFAAIANKVYGSNYNFHKAVNENVSYASVPNVQSGNRYDLNTVLNRFEVKKQVKGAGDWVKAAIERDKVSIVSVKVEKNQVPDVRGMGLSDAMYLLEKQGMTVRSEGFGRVVYQSIIPGTSAVSGGVIELRLR